LYDKWVNNWKRKIARKVIQRIHPYLYDTYVTYGAGTLTIGERCGLGNTLFNLSSGDIVIGNRAAFGHNVMCLTGTHQFHNGQRISIWPEYDDGSYGGDRHEVPKEGRNIIVGDGCFIGSGAILIGPVVIGANSIVCAGAVVLKNIPPHSIVAGIPGKIIGDTLDLRYVVNDSEGMTS
jgi:acetyltransferase-like isoleucine patch superfamily enzyme